jgi:hypothetical protein
MAEIPPSGQLVMHRLAMPSLALANRMAAAVRRKPYHARMEPRTNPGGRTVHCNRLLVLLDHAADLP